MTQKPNKNLKARKGINVENNRITGEIAHSNHTSM
jgi:hypothetical protein